MKVLVLRHIQGRLVVHLYLKQESYVSYYVRQVTDVNHTARNSILIHAPHISLKQCVTGRQPTDYRVTGIVRREVRRVSVWGHIQDRYL